MQFKIIPDRLRKQSKTIFNQNERLNTNVVDNHPVSTFDNSFRHLTTFNSGKLVPIFCKETLPADIFSFDVNTLLRLSTPNSATMENAIFDIAFFFVPNRIIWDKFKYFMGENKSAGFQKEYKQIPVINYDTELKYNANDLASYLGFPQQKDMSKTQLPINSLYFKAYIKIWNDFYRDENLQDEIDNTNNNNNDANVKVSDYIDKDYNLSLQIGKGLAPVSRLADYFSTCLPYPQKGDGVSIDTLPIANLLVDFTNTHIGNKTNPDGSANVNDLFSQTSFNPDGSIIKSDTIGFKPKGVLVNSLGNNSSLHATNTDTIGVMREYSSLNLFGDAGIKLKDGVTSFYSVNDLRLALALQHLRELDARGGTRYTEILLNHFGVDVNDSRLDRAEYIGGFRDYVQIDNIVQSSSSVENKPLGMIGGVSVTSSQNPNKIEYACKEHGIIMGFIIVRPQVNYSQGLDKQFTKVDKYDFYDPLLANIGEQPIYKYELYLDDKDDANTNNDIFGYNEAWADYRYSKNLLSGSVSVNSPTSLAVLYAYTEKYSNAPTLSSDWMKQDESVIGDTLIMSESAFPEFVQQFMGDFYFNLSVTRKMPVYSIPGLKKV